MTLHVNPATPTITWATPTAITYGTALSSTQLNAKATDINGKAVLSTFSYTATPIGGTATTVNAGTVLPAGTSTLSVSFIPNDQVDYNNPPALVSVTLTYFDFPREHWRCLRTNNPLERVMREIRRRTRVVGAFPDGRSALMLVAARLRYVAGTRWVTKRYLNMTRLAHSAVA